MLSNAGVRDNRILALVLSAELTKRKQARKSVYRAEVRPSQINLFLHLKDFQCHNINDKRQALEDAHLEIIRFLRRRYGAWACRYSVVDGVYVEICSGRVVARITHIESDGDE